MQMGTHTVHLVGGPNGAGSWYMKPPVVKGGKRIIVLLANPGGFPFYTTLLQVRTIHNSDKKTAGARRSS